MVGGNVTMEQLFAIMMQHQHMIEHGNTGHSAWHHHSVETALSSSSSSSSLFASLSVQDQMTAELAAASSAVEDIFGDESVKAAGSGAMTMVEQVFRTCILILCSLSLRKCS
jgi:hypothetical protein